MAIDRAITVIDDAWLRRQPMPRASGELDKAERGVVLVVAGSREMPGAARLAALAAFRAGAGKVTVATAASVAPGLALTIDEARVVGLAETDDGGLRASDVGRLDDVLGGVDALLVGPGLQDDEATCALTRALLDSPALRPQAVRIVDALAMNVLRRGPFARTVLVTPHRGEMAHLLGLETSARGGAAGRSSRGTHDGDTSDGGQDDHDEHGPHGAPGGADEGGRQADKESLDLDDARDAARRWNAIVAMKGAETFLATPDGRAWRHAAERPGLGTSGSGDVLAGVIAGLAARGLPLEDAAAWGVALHARAGGALEARHGPIGYLASELAAEVPRLLARFGGDGGDDGGDDGERRHRGGDDTR